MKPEDLKEVVELAGGVLDEIVGSLPDGSGFATASFPIPDDHWSRVGGRNVPPMPFRCGEEEGGLRRVLEAECRAAARYAVRASTLNGREVDFDPDAMVQNFIVGMLGYYTSDGLSSGEPESSSLRKESFSRRRVG